MNKTSVLIVDDDPKIRKLVNVNLARRNYSVREVGDGMAAISAIQDEVPDLVILDLVMPGKSGNDVCVWIRDQGLDIPVIVLSAHDDESLKVTALDSGADDYITKPFKVEEFMARMRAIMRRTGNAELTSSDIKIQVEGISVDFKSRRAFVDNLDMHLTRTEFALLAVLTQNVNAILTHDELLAKVWGEEYRGSSHYLHVYLGRIRKKMTDKYSMLLETIPGMGYLFHDSLPL